MSNSYYNHGSFPATGSAATSASMRAELQLIASGFDKLPTLSGNANRFVVVNSTGTGLIAVSNLPAFTATDSDFLVQDNADNSKKFRFEAAGISIGTTRVLTVPDANTTLVGTDVAQTLINKTLTTPVLSGTASGTTAGRLGYNTGVFTFGDGSNQRTVVTTDNTQTLTNKTLTSPVISSIVNSGTLTLPTSTDTLVGRATTDTLTNKTISGANNTLSNIGNSSLTNSSINFTYSGGVTGSASTALGGTNALSLSNVPNASLQNSSITFGSTAQALGSTVSALNGVSIGATTASTGAFTTLSSSSTTTLNGTTIPASVTLVSTAATQTLTNKTINLANNTLTATSAQIAAAVTDETGTGALVFGTSPTINTPTVSGGTINNTVIGGTTAAAGTFTTLTADNIIAPNVAAIGQFSWDNNATTTSVAKPQVTPSSTLLSSIHGRMRGCLLLNNGQVNYYLNPTNWAQKEDGSASVLTGADGMVMVEIPKFYVKNESSGTLWKPVISATPLPGYAVHPAFIKDGVEVPYRYYSAYDACVFRPSTSTYFSGTNLDNNSANVNTASDQLASVSGIYPMVGLTRNEFRLLAANRGTGWRVGDFTLWSAIGILMAVEAQTLNGQAVYGAGNTGNSYLTSSSNQNDSPHTIAGAGNALGNGSTNTTSGASNTNRPGTSYMKYRGIENFWGNCWNWTDGINIFSEGNTAGNKVFAYWSNNRANFADDTATNYGLLGEIANTLANTRYGAQFSQDNVWALVTTGFSTTSTHGTSDFYFTNSGWRVLRVGGGASDGGGAGAFAFVGDSASSNRSRTVGARLAY